MKKIMIAFLALCMLLCGCQAKPQESSGGNPEHIYREINERLIVDAPVAAGPEGYIPKIYRGHHQVMDKDEAEALLNHLGDSVANVTQDEIVDNYWYRFNGTCASGAIFWHDHYVNNHYPGSGLFYSLCYNDEDERRCYENYPITTGHRALDEEQAASLLTYLFTEPVEMSFATEEEAEAAAREALACLGLENLILERTLYVSHDRLAQVDEILHTDPLWIDPEGGWYTKEEWTPEDDCYMLEFNSSIDGIPMSVYHLDLGTFIYAPNYITVYYTKDGIISLRAECPWIQDEVVEIPDHVITAEEALDLALEKLANVVSRETTTVDNISLLYMYFQDGDAWLLKPVWDVRYRTTAPYAPDGFLETDHFLVNAITGEEI